MGDAPDVERIHSALELGIGLTKDGPYVAYPADHICSVVRCSGLNGELEIPIKDNLFQEVASHIDILRCCDSPELEDGTFRSPILIYTMPGLHHISLLHGGRLHVSSRTHFGCF